MEQRERRPLVRREEQSPDAQSNLRYGLIGTVNFYIKEYLEKSHFTQSQETFVRECNQLQVPIDEAIEDDSVDSQEEIVSERTIEELVDMFDNTYEDAFFTIWDDPGTVPHVHDTTSYLKINFRLHIYFCCRKIAESLSPASDCLQTIRDFFDREGTALSNEQEFIHYFALPFVTNPQDHPTFKGLFEYNNWMRLRNDLRTYLSDIRLSEQFSSKLMKLVLMNSIGPGKEIYQHFVMKENDAMKLKKKYSVLVANHQQLRKDYQKLIGKLRL
ncbi:lisH domain-containing protein ARMC9-like [Tigriopus californicus]|uniref:lisH domain-containing protein ARMC9-like n=1 Tax=Tigriopus californicus TaxID=6832 RepID=UPI0027DA35DA|nr:lisH domain-containing protein ARMC9-like [Tigriopus californicus]